MTASAPLSGVGLGLRWAFIDAVAAGEAPSIPFFEIAPENYIRRGGQVSRALEEVAARIPLLSHGLMLGIGGEEALEPGYLGDLRRTLDTLGIDRHSDHLCWSDAGGRCLHDLLPLPLDRRLIPAIVDRIRRAQDHLGRPFAVENISYYGIPGWDPADGGAMGLAERDFLAEIVDRAGCGLLLDVNNVLVNARNHGFDPEVYLAGLDLRRVVEIHVAGGERLPRYGGMIIDTHGSDVSPEVAALMAWVIARRGPLPVIYERDHRIPPLAALVAEVAGLQRIYDQALDLWRASAAQEPPPADPPRSGAAPAGGLPCGDLGALQRGFARRILASPAEQIASEIAEEAEVAEAAAALAAMGPARLEIYRGLVRGSLHRLLAELLPRTLARLEGQGAAWIDRWLAEVGPRSRLLREVVGEWVTWVRAGWARDPEVAAYLGDLLDLEATELLVEAAPAVDPALARAASPDFAVDAQLLIDPSVRLRRYASAVHRLPEEVDDRQVPEAVATALLAYRDAEHEVRFLELSPLAAAVVGELLAGATVRRALVAATQALGLALDDGVLGRMVALFADLAARGILHGCLPASPTPPPSPPSPGPRP